MQCSVCASHVRPTPLSLSSIQVLVSAGDNLTLTFEGDTADAVAVSFQQCSGSEYMSMEIYYDLYSLRSGTLSSNTCHRVRTNPCFVYQNFD